MNKDRVFLRILESTDIETTQKWLNRDEIGEVMGYMPHSLVHQENWFAAATKDQSKYIFAICKFSDKSHIGNIALGNIDWIDRNAMLSIFIAEPENRRVGYGSAAVELILKFAFNRLNLHKVCVRTSSNYPGTLDFYLRLGFVKEGVLREQKYQYGAYHDKHVFGILKNEFKQRLR